MSTTTDLSTLVINYLTQAQYEAAVSGGTIDEDQLYLTPATGSGVTDVEVNGTSVVTGGVAEVTVPTKVSDLSNDSGFLTSAVTSFNGNTGAVTYTAPVTSVNGNTGAVTLSIPTITDTYSGTSSNGMSGKAVKSAIDALDATISGSAGAGKTLTAFSQTDGKVSATFSNISITKSQISDFPTIPTITDTYSGTSSNGMSGKAVKSAIDALDATISGSAGSSKTLTAFSQTDGKVSATFGNISITKSQVSDFPTIPTKVSDLTNDSGFITGYTETDPIFTASAAHGISSTDISNWNGKSDFSGSYNDLTNKPTIPTVLDFYPVGSYYETSDSTFDPNISWGGTWLLEAEGLVHIGAGANYTIGDTGGEATHTLTENEMPAHQHRMDYVNYNRGTGSNLTMGYLSQSTQENFGITTSTGGGLAHNIMQPYVVVNRWHRTA